jgi:hypothetical protein
VGLICKIHNRCATDFSQILLRKFYQVIFIEKDLKTLNIYTAVVVGSEDSNNRKILTKNSFGLDLSYQFIDETDNNINFTKIKHTNKSNSFGEDISAWKRVWGNNTGLLKDPDELRNSFNTHFTATDMPNALGNNYEFLIISDDAFTKENDTIAKIIVNPDVNLSNYSIINDTDISKGIEIVNFTKTEITLPNQISTVFDFQLEFEKAQKYQLNDFSLYFVLPEGYGLGDKEAFTFKNNTANTKDRLVEPFETLGNNIASYIKEWITEGIEDRTYFRIYNPEKLKKFNTNTDFYKIQIKASLTSIINPLINQLLYGFVIALFFTYGLDQTRLMNYRELYLCYTKIPPDINFIVTFGLLFVSILFKISIGKKKERGLIYIVRILGIISALCWLVCFYWFGSQNFYSTDFLTKPSYFPVSLICKSHILNISTFALNFISCCWLYIFYKNEITLSFRKQLMQILKRHK